VLGALVLKVALDIAYALVVPSTHYYALLGTQFNWVKLVESYPLIVIGLLALPRDMTRLSTLVLWLIALLALVPMGTVYAFHDEPRAFMYATVGFFVLCGLATRLLPDLELPSPPAWLRNRSAAVIYGSMVAVAVAVIVVYTGGELLINIARVKLDLSGAYVNRAEFVAAGLPLKGYYFHWLALVFNPVFLVWAVLKRKWWVIPFLLLLQFAIGSEVGARSYYLDLPFVLGVALLALRATQARTIALVAALAVLFTAVIAVAAHKVFPFDFVAGRFLLLPSQLSFLYYDFFSTHGLIPGAYLYKFFFRIHYPLQYPFADSPPFVIGAYYYHDRSLFAITGILGDAFMNFGFAGLALGAIVLAIVLRTVDAVSIGLDRRLAMAAVIMPAVAITETFFIRVIFTTGLLWMFLILYLLPRPARAATSEEALAEPWRAGLRALRLLIHTQYFPPEVGAAQTRLFNVAQALVASGSQVEVVTAMPNYPSGRVADRYRNRWSVRERMGEIPVTRSFILPVRHADARRLISYLSFQLASLPALFRRIGAFKPDFLFIESPPLFLGLTGILVKRTLGIPFIFNVADLWPDWAVEMGAIRRGGLMHRVALAIERLIYREAEFVTIVVAQMAEALEAKGVSAEKILFLPNGVDVAAFARRRGRKAGEAATATAIREAAAKRPVVLYAGTIGAYHGLQTALDAAARLRDRPVLFAFVGDGAEKQKLLASARSMGLDNVRFFDPVPADQVPDLLATAAIALSVIKIPTRAAKVLPAMAAGVPIVYAGRGEGADLVTEAGAGVVVDPDRPADLAAAITSLLDDRARSTGLGAAGRRYVARNLDWKELVEAWVSSLSERSDHRPLEPRTADSSVRLPVG
jgi:glycosyltransferase involved in cell wall biosynthesis